MGEYDSKLLACDEEMQRIAVRSCPLLACLLPPVSCFSTGTWSLAIPALHRHCSMCHAVVFHSEARVALVWHVHVRCLVRRP
jgi:hypothetical protein